MVPAATPARQPVEPAFDATSQGGVKAAPPEGALAATTTKPEARESFEEHEIVYVIDLDSELVNVEEKEPETAVEQGVEAASRIESPRQNRANSTTYRREHGPEVLLMEMPLDATTVEVRNINTRTVELKSKPRTGGARKKSAASEPVSAKGVVFEMPLDATSVEVRHFNSRTIELRSTPEETPTSCAQGVSRRATGHRTMDMPLDATSVEIRNLSARTVEVKAASDGDL